MNAAPIDPRVLITIWIVVVVVSFLVSMHTLVSVLRSDSSSEAEPGAEAVEESSV